MKSAVSVFLTALILCISLISTAVRADDSKPGYLELNEISDGRYSVLWRSPRLPDTTPPLTLRLPSSVETLTPPVTTELPNTTIERRLVQADPDSFLGSRLEIDGLRESNTDVLVRIEFANGASSTTLLKPTKSWMIIQGPRTAIQITWDYTVLGFEHILEGFDHLLFVLALLLIVGPTKRLFWAITSFTAAHSLTLAAATMGLLWVPGPPVEAVIALSILFLAGELYKTTKGEQSLTSMYPWLVAFTFGLLHGLGFAGALADIGLPPHEIPLALLMFNVGVELGQLTFVFCVLVVMYLLKPLKKYYPIWAHQLPSYWIGSIAAFWVIERVSGF